MKGLASFVSRNASGCVTSWGKQAIARPDIVVAGSEDAEVRCREYPLHDGMTVAPQEGTIARPTFVPVWRSEARQIEREGMISGSPSLTVDIFASATTYTPNTDATEQEKGA